jgi:hypothetical protein
MDFCRDHSVLIIDSIRKKSNSTYNRTSLYNRKLRVGLLDKPGQQFQLQLFFISTQKHKRGL